MQLKNDTTLDSDEIDIQDLLRALRRSSLWILMWSFVGLGIGLTVGLLRDRMYEAAVLVSVREDSDSGGVAGGLGALASQMGGLASLAGVSLGNGNNKEQYIAVLQSEFLTEKYIRDHDLLPILYEGKWDAQRKQWKSSDPKMIPTLWKANDFFKKHVRTVSEDKKTGLVSLKITWKDPKIAATWANDLVNQANVYLRQRAIDESERHIAYLNEQAPKTDIMELKASIYSLMQQEINKVMMARGRDEYAFRIIDPAVAPERPSTLGALGLSVIGFTVGFLFSVASIVGRRVLSNK